MVSDLPSMDSLPVLLDPPDGLLLQPTTLYDRSGGSIIVRLKNPASEGSQYVYISKPGELTNGKALDYLVNATIATVEPTYWSSSDLFISNLFERDKNQIAKRLVTDILISQEPSGMREMLRERLLASQVIDKFGREKVLEWYLNSAKYGNLIYGVDAAARAYFGKPASELNLAEAAFIVAIGETPEVDPWTTTQVVLDQQSQIIQSMLSLGLISADDAYQAGNEELTIQPKVEVENPAPAFVDLVVNQLNGQLPIEHLERGGINIITTLDYDLQMQASCATEAHLNTLAGVQINNINLDRGECEAARLLPTLWFDNQDFSDGFDAEVVIIDPSTGQILAMVGELPSGLNTAQQTIHQSGTILTPFTYLTAFTRGMSPATMLWDVPGTLESQLYPGDLNGKEMGEDTGRVYHGPLRLRTGFANDYIGPAIQVMNSVGLDIVWQTATQFGISSLNKPNGGSYSGMDFFETDLSLLEITQAYGVFANQGALAGQYLFSPGNTNNSNRMNSVSVLSVNDSAGGELVDWSIPQIKPIVSPQLSYLVTHVMSDESSRWASLGHPNPLEIGKPAGVKVGQTNNKGDAWTVGYIPQMAVGIWMGYPDRKSGEVSVDAAAALWHAIIQYASRDLPLEDWQVPQGISFIDVCVPSGKLPTGLCPTVVTEVFLNGSEPTQADNLYKSFQVNRETGRLATVLTPPELVEERVYLDIPPQAEEWAQSAGLPIPPDTYDAVYSPSPANPNVQINEPEMFAYVSGVVPIKGSAYGDDFSYYRLQVGQGLNPQEWFLVGEDITTPVVGGLLGEWDTKGLSGLYAVQLFVVFEDQLVERDLIQVTIDDQPPDILILNPDNNQNYSFADNRLIILNVEADDNMVLDRVEFYIDDLMEMVLYQAPFIITWNSKLGDHEFRVVAFDLAGNINEAQVDFTIGR
jgi:membrane peptidoglycan carboxypeptidase